MDQKISIILPVYNVEQYLHRCIDSILAQSYSNFELIVIDDGSTDGSSIICDNFIQIDNRIKVYHKKNGGLSDARNFGLQCISGDFITFIDSDDHIHKDYLKCLYGMIVSTESDISIVNFEKVIEGSTPKNDHDKKEIIKYNTNEALEQLLNGKYSTQFTIACAKLFKRSVFDEIRFPLGRHYEDSATAHFWFSKAKKVVFTTDTLYYYMQRSGSIKNSEKFDNCDMVMASHDRLSFFKKWNDGFFFDGAYEQYISCCLAVYPRLTTRMNIQKREIINDLRKMDVQVKRGEIKLSTVCRCRLFLASRCPNLYALVIKLCGACTFFRG